MLFQVQGIGIDRGRQRGLVLQHIEVVLRLVEHGPQRRETGLSGRSFPRTAGKRGPGHRVAARRRALRSPRGHRRGYRRQESCRRCVVPAWFRCRSWRRRRQPAGREDRPRRHSRNETPPPGPEAEPEALRARSRVGQNELRSCAVQCWAARGNVEASSLSVLPVGSALERVRRASVPGSRSVWG